MDKSILEVVHESAKGLYDAGIVDATTMHEFDALCLRPVENLTAYTSVSNEDLLICRFLNKLDV